MKIDVEGAELGVLKGAANTIDKYSPPLYMEMDREDKNEELLRYLHDRHAYVCYTHKVPLFNEANWKQNPQEDKSFIGVVSINALCVHQSEMNRVPNHLVPGALFKVEDRGDL